MDEMMAGSVEIWGVGRGEIIDGDFRSGANKILPIVLEFWVRVWKNEGGVQSRLM